MAKKKDSYKDVCDKAVKMMEEELIPFHKAQTFVVNPKLKKDIPTGKK